MVDTAPGATIVEVPQWLPPDTEDSVMGTEWHQEAIEALAGMIEEVARRRGATWGVCRGIALLESGGRYPDGRAYDPRPDVMVLAQPLRWGGQAGVRLAEVGVPLFIVEVASRSTIGNDVGPKCDLYGAIGVPEYLVFDAVGNVLVTPLLAWRRARDDFAPWPAEDDGWWRSQSLDVALQPTQPFMSVRDHDGRPIDLARAAHARVEYLERELEETQRRLADWEERQRQALDNP